MHFNIDGYFSLLLKKKQYLKMKYPMILSFLSFLICIYLFIISFFYDARDDLKA